MLTWSRKVNNLCECMFLFTDVSKSKVASQAQIYTLIHVYLCSTLCVFETFFVRTLCLSW